MDESAISLNAKSLQAAKELYSEFWDELLAFVEKINFCADDCAQNLEALLPAMGLIRDTAWKSFERFDKLHERITQIFEQQNPS